MILIWIFQFHILHLHIFPILVHFTSRGLLPHLIILSHPHPGSGRATGPPSPGSASSPGDPAPAASSAAPGAWGPAWETSPGIYGDGGMVGWWERVESAFKEKIDIYIYIHICIHIYIYTYVYIIHIWEFQDPKFIGGT